MPYPVTFEVDYVESRSRLTAFFRLILAIPLFIWLYLYAIAAYILVVIAWFAIGARQAHRSIPRASTPSKA